MTVLVRSGSVAGSRRYALELVRPSSVVVAGGGSESATVSALGSVDFANATSLSLNDVFSAGYDNYMVVVRYTGSGSNVAFKTRLRASGTDNSTASSYVYQLIAAVSTSISGARTTSNEVRLGNSDTGLTNGLAVNVYGPYLAQPTAMRSVSAYSFEDATIVEYAATHNQSTSYDGITIYPDSGTLSGLVAVYGLRG